MNSDLPNSGLSTQADPLITATGIRKTFGPTVALDNAQAVLYPGEIHALMGENGSGKSTLLTILAGAQPADAGTITLHGRDLVGLTPAEARARGIAVVSQEPQLAPALTVGENIFLGRLPRRAGGVSWRETHRRAAEILAELQLDIDPRVAVSTLSLGRRQMVEIAKALADRPQVLLLDEATSSLDEADTRTLFALLSRLRAAGTAIGFVSHRMTEVMEHADRATVLRDGQYIGTRKLSETDEHELVSMMVGRDLKSYWHKASVAQGDALLRMVRVARGPLKSIDLTVNRGEIVGLAGLVGSGRSALLRTIAGVRPMEAGEMFLNRKAVRIRSPRQARQLGVGYVPEDRKGEGLVMHWSLYRNAGLSRVAALPVLAPISERIDRAAYAQGTQGLKVRTADPRQAVSELSGGNQQKVLIARELAITPDLLLLDEPTRGVDVGAKEDIYAQIAHLVRGGMGLMIASSELQELIGVCDRILVLFQGQIVADIPARDAREETLAYWASGAHLIGAA
ncbi:sugar ABC transporter ATP-binding protein [Pseudooceanicola sediminis]|uniref:Sugar ABC transporter ATP-binding protein n=1 Tax=Pseudooceanicola sediminis TaxID=2211117 RepID=A0A399IY18_9RHOB|nr:sugar ABC transporter ATP-binding protein [Pseudooceanicola sediminis]RII37870.1 sugar ABC transporter ATP-binding protein [Pseudooceanicola sediminis]|tara:strand:+ start:52612 stop:54147 length:1536 start_codon:yes stop_codon:yes gene_type:complete